MTMTDGSNENDYDYDDDDYDDHNNNTMNDDDASGNNDNDQRSMKRQKQQHQKAKKSSSMMMIKNHQLVEDAKFLRNETAVVDVSNTMELHRTNLMKMQTQELLDECQINDLSTRKWSSEAQQYLQHITTIIRTIEIGSSTTTVDTMTTSHPKHKKHKKQSSSKKQKSGRNSLIVQGSYRDRADKVVHIQVNDSNNSNSLPSPSSSFLSVEPIGCTRANIGWMKRSGNAQTVPTFTLMVMIPSTLWNTKDYLHYRYFDKRNYVMDQVSRFLAEHHSNELGTIEYIWPKGSSRSPVLKLTPPTKSSSKFQVHLHFGMKSIDWIPPLRLVPNRYNVRQDTPADNEDSNFRAVEQNQIYNNQLLYDARHEFEDEQLSSLVGNVNTLATLSLIQIWALQRGLWRNHDGWTQENVAVYLLYLLRTNRMNSRMTPIQQLTVAMQFWATTNWLGDHNDQDKRGSNDDHDNNGGGIRASQSESSQFVKANDRKDRRRTVLVLPLEDSKEKDTIRKSTLASLYEQQTKESPLTDSDPSTLLEAYSSTSEYCLGPVMLDPEMRYNYLGDVSPNYMKLLQLHARKCVESLKAPLSTFRTLFMDSARFWTQWDMYVKIPVDTTSEHDWQSSTRYLVRKLELALGNRIHGMRVLSTGNGNVKSKKDLADEIPDETIGTSSTYIRRHSLSPTGKNEIVIGLAINPETSRRIVDRGPPSDQTVAMKAFVDLWGKSKAQLRRFKDGAIVQAVVWNDDIHSGGRYQNCERVQGGFVESIVRHIVQLHFTTQPLQFSFPNLLSVVDGMKPTDPPTATPVVDPLSAHQNIMKAFESLVDFLRRHSQNQISGNRTEGSLGIPLPIDAVEPLSPCLRYSELFPPTPHPFLGGTSPQSKKVAGVLLSDPILIQIRFGTSSKWPTDLKAIGAAKTAMLVQLANGIDALNDRNFDGPTQVTTHFVDVGYRGYCFRILVRADPEIKLLQGLVQPSTKAAILLKDLTRAHVISSKHHSLVHAVHTMHPSAPFVVRMAKRWCDSHLLSGLVTTQVIELIVARVYSGGSTTIRPPSTVLSGFLGFLRLLADHDWAGEPFIVNARGHIDDDDIDLINEEFDKIRGVHRKSGPPMYIIAPYDKVSIDDEEDITGQSVVRNAVNTQKSESWNPSTISPELVVLNRTVALARRSYDYMTDQLSSFDDASSEGSEWCAIFQESPQSFHSYDVLLRVNPDLVVDDQSSSTAKDLNPKPAVENRSTGSVTAADETTAYTRSMIARNEGPKVFRKKVYRNIAVANNDGDRSPGGNVLPAWNPVRAVVESLRVNFGQYALFFYNDLSPEVIGIVWRPQTFHTSAFSAMTSEFARPVEDEQQNWTNDTLVRRSDTDLLREMSPYFEDVITTIKVLHQPRGGQTGLQPQAKKQKLS